MIVAGVWDGPTVTRFAPDIPPSLRTHSDIARNSCPLCRQLTFDGRVLHVAGRSKPEQRVAARLRAFGLHVHTCCKVNDYEADIVLTGVPRPTIVEYDGHYYHDDAAVHDDKQRNAWTRGGYRVVRLREPKLPVTDAWDLALPQVYERYGEQPGPTILAHILEVAGVTSPAHHGRRPRIRKLDVPQGWWTVAHDGVPTTRWRTHAAAAVASGTTVGAARTPRTLSMRFGPVVSITFEPDGG